MPELPEVEEVRRSLEPHLIGHRVMAVSVARKDFVTGNVERIAGHAFAATHRHGKKLFLRLDDHQTLLIHLGMSGRIDVTPPDAKLEPHTHVTITLDSGLQIRHRDPRRFGGLWHFPDYAAALEKETARIGPDALLLTPTHLAHWKQAKGRLKARLLSQKDVAGLGNIYVDEALWMSQLHPLQRVSRLKPADIQRLTDAILQVLNNSIRSGGTTLRDYRNVSDQPGEFARHLQAYGRAHKPCLRCQAPLKMIQITARTTVFCRVCQRQR